MVVSAASSAMLLVWSDAVGRVPMKTLLVVTILLVVGQICYRCCVQHRLESLDMRVDLFIVLGEMGVIWSISILEAMALWVGVH
jgi:predicted membrane channel-forming protein YqfA (hemolysin III family)